MTGERPVFHVARGQITGTLWSNQDCPLGVVGSHWWAPITLYINCRARHLARCSTSWRSSWVVMLLRTDVKAEQQKHIPHQRHSVGPTFKVSGESGRGETLQAASGLRFRPNMQEAETRQQNKAWKKCPARCSHTDYITLFFMKIQTGKWQLFVQELLACDWVTKYMLSLLGIWLGLVSALDLKT